VSSASINARRVAASIRAGYAKDTAKENNGRISAKNVLAWDAGPYSRVRTSSLMIISAQVVKEKNKISEEKGQHDW
jgi:hypothetical protein